LTARDYHGLRTQAGVAPVTRQSGKRLLVGMRYACNPRLRNALYYWGFISVRYDAHSRQHYRRLRGHGHSHGRALRGVADCLLTLLLAMLAQQTMYDPARRRAAPRLTTGASSSKVISSCVVRVTRQELFELNVGARPA